MKKVLHAVLLSVFVLSGLAWTYLDTDLFYNKTKVLISNQKSEVRITKLTTRQELEIIKQKFEQIGVRFNIKRASFSGQTLNSIDVVIDAPNGIRGNYRSTNMRLTREFKIVVYNDSDAAFTLIRIG